MPPMLLFHKCRERIYTAVHQVKSVTRKLFVHHRIVRLCLIPCFRLWSTTCTSISLFFHYSRVERKVVSIFSYFAINSRHLESKQHTKTTGDVQRIKKEGHVYAIQEKMWSFRCNGIMEYFMKNILNQHAYSKKGFLFLKILQQIRNPQKLYLLQCVANIQQTRLNLFSLLAYFVYIKANCNLWSQNMHRLRMI